MIVSGWSIDRGRSYELDKTAPGTATITMIDTTGELDPTNPAYAFEPMTPAAIALRNPVTSTDHTVFRGYIARLDYDLYQTEDYAVVTLDLVDGMDLLEAIEMTASVPAAFGDVIVGPGIGQDVIFYEDDQVADRINEILDQCDFPGGLREVFSGNVRLQETVYSGRASAMSAISDAADAEFPGVANFYFQGVGVNAGKATFHGRLARFHPEDANYHISTWRCGDMAAVAADSTRAVIFELGFDKDKDKVINSALATPQGIVDADIPGQLVEDASSKTTFGTRSISFENLLTLNDHFGAADANEATLKFANYYVSNYAQPRTRVNKITFKRVGPTDPYAARLWTLMTQVDISDIIRLKTTHQAGGFDEDFFVEGLHMSAGPLSPDYDDVTLTLDVSPRAYYDTNPFE